MSVFTVLLDKEHEVKRGSLSEGTLENLKRSLSKRDADAICVAIRVAFDSGHMVGYGKAKRDLIAELRKERGS